MLALLISFVLWGMILCLTLVTWAWITVEVVEWARDFHREGMERKQVRKRADKCLEMLVELDKMARE